MKPTKMMLDTVAEIFALGYLNCQDDLQSKLDGIVFALSLDSNTQPLEIRAEIEARVELLVSSERRRKLILEGLITDQAFCSCLILTD